MTAVIMPNMTVISREPVMVREGCEIFYLAVCQGCTPLLPQPFSVEVEREKWLLEHALATRHTVTRAAEVRPGS